MTPREKYCLAQYTARVNHSDWREELILLYPNLNCKADNIDLREAEIQAVLSQAGTFLYDPSIGATLYHETYFLARLHREQRFILIAMIIAIIASFIIGFILAPKPIERSYTDIPLKQYSSYDGIHWGFKDVH